MPPTTNDPMPPIQTQDQNGQPISLADFAQTHIVLFVYPRADTSGCTLEACAFRDLYAEIKATGTTVLGLSRDTVKAQKKFSDKFTFPYPLLADPDESIVQFPRPHQAQEHVRQAGQRRRTHHLPHRTPTTPPVTK